MTAEGVEDEETLCALASMDCDEVQGYHLCRPLPVTQFDAWYEARARSGNEAGLTSCSLQGTGSPW